MNNPSIQEMQSTRDFLEGEEETAGPENYEESHGRYYVWAVLEAALKALKDRNGQLRAPDLTPTTFHVLLGKGMYPSSITASLNEVIRAGCDMSATIKDFNDLSLNGHRAKSEIRHWLGRIFETHYWCKVRIVNIRTGLEGRRAKDVDRDLETFLDTFPYNQSALSGAGQFVQKAHADQEETYQESEEGYLFNLFSLVREIENNLHELNVELESTARHFQHARVDATA